MEFRIERYLFAANSSAAFVMSVRAGGKAGAIYVKCGGNTWQHLIINGCVYLYVTRGMPSPDLHNMYAVAEKNLAHQNMVDSFCSETIKFITKPNLKIVKCTYQ